MFPVIFSPQLTTALLFRILPSVAYSSQTVADWEHADTEDEGVAGCYVVPKFRIHHFTVPQVTYTLLQDMKASPIWPVATSLTASTTPFSNPGLFSATQTDHTLPQDIWIGYSHWNVLNLDGFVIVAKAFQVTFSSKDFSAQNKNSTSA